MTRIEAVRDHRGWHVTSQGLGEDTLRVRVHRDELSIHVEPADELQVTLGRPEKETPSKG